MKRYLYIYVENFGSKFKRRGQKYNTLYNECIEAAERLAAAL